jgi:photosystem II stability/assembly factor-like uncharacterized protein
VKYTIYLFCFSLLLIHLCCDSKKTQPEGKTGSSWQRIGPGGGGTTFNPTLSFHSPDVIMMSCDMSGSYLTRDGGKSWDMFNFPGGSRPKDFAFDPSDEKAIYACAAGLHQSLDQGKSWKLVYPPPDSVTGLEFNGANAGFHYKLTENCSLVQDVSCVCVDPANSDRILVSVSDRFKTRMLQDGTLPRHEILLSTDRGKSWATVLSAKENVHTIYPHPKDKGVFWLFTNQRLYGFDSGSGKITEKVLPPSVVPALSISCGVDRESGRIFIYALMGTHGQETTRRRGIAVSRDGGHHWDFPKILPDEGVAVSFRDISCSRFNGRTAYVMCTRFIEKDKKGEGNLYGLFKTADGGHTWNWVYKEGRGVSFCKPSNLKDSWAEKAFYNDYISMFFAGAFSNNGDCAVINDWYRCMITRDGGKTWEEMYSRDNGDGTYTSRGMDVTTTYGVHFDPFDSNHIAISYTDIGYHHSFDRGKSWTRAVKGVPRWVNNTCYWVVFDPEIKDKVWSVWSNGHDFPRGKMNFWPRWKSWVRGGVYVSTTGGREWQHASANLGEHFPGTCIILDPTTPAGNRTLYFTSYGKGVFKSVDDGKTWQEMNNGLGQNLNAWEITRMPDGTLFLVITPTPDFSKGEATREPFWGEVYRSTNGAQTWERVALPENVRFPNSITFDPHQPDHLYLACWADLYLSDFISLKRTGATGGNVHIDNKGGVLFSPDAGKTWTSIFDTTRCVYGIALDRNKKGRIVINTFNHAAYQSDDAGKTWKKFPGYDFSSGHRPIFDRNDPGKIYLTTFGSSVLHGPLM